MENETNLKERRKAYWRANLRILAILMSIWCVIWLWHPVCRASEPN